MIYIFEAFTNTNSDFIHVWLLSCVEFSAYFVEEERCQLRLSLDAEVAPVQPLDDDEGVSPDDVFTGTTGIPSERYAACWLLNRWNVMPSRVKLPMPSDMSRLRALQAVRARLINSSVLLFFWCFFTASWAA